MPRRPEPSDYWVHTETKYYAAGDDMTDDIVIGGDSADIPNGTYMGTLTAWTVKHSDKFDNDFRVWTFELDNTHSIVEGASSMATSAKSKGGRWIASLLGRKPDKGETVKVIGCSALVVVSSDRTEWPEVTDVLPPLATGPVTAAEAEVVVQSASRSTAAQKRSGVVVEEPAELDF